jgi:Tol biopolymer transport system component
MKRICALAIVAASLVFATAADAAFPGENGKVMFVRSNQDYVNYQIHLANPDGTGITNVGGTGLSSTTDPEWSADGSRSVYRAYSSAGYAFFFKRADGSDDGTLRPPWDSVDNPSWSPDGKELVYDFSETTYCDYYICYGFSGIRRIKLDGTGDRELLSYGSDPAWSPDGSKIAFVASGEQGYNDIYVMNADGSGVTNLSRNGAPEERPTWSPDGTRIAFERWIGFDTDVYVMNADGSSQQNLTSNPAAYEGNAAWSPDGNWILFARAGVLYKIRPDGTTLTYFSGDGHDGTPDWQPIVNQLPDCAAAVADPSNVWPPNGRLVGVTIGGATDPDGDEVTLTIDGVTQDEPVWRTPDARLGSERIRLRAERSPRGDGRVYRIAFTVADGRGGECSGVATVEVRRHKERPAVDSAPPSYDSLGR